MKTIILTILCFLPIISNANAQNDTLTVQQAKNYIGKTVWIKMYVAELRAGINDGPDYLNIGEKYPNNPLCIAIFDTQAFAIKTGYPPIELVGKHVLCFAKLTTHRDKIQILPKDLKKIIIQ